MTPEKCLARGRHCHVTTWQTEKKRERMGILGERHALPLTVTLIRPLSSTHQLYSPMVWLHSQSPECVTMGPLGISVQPDLNTLSVITLQLTCQNGTVGIGFPL